VSAIDAYLEAAPVPLGLPASEVEKRLGKALKVLEKDGRPTGFEYKGLWIALEEGEVSSVSFLTGSPEHGGAHWDGALPGGLRTTDSPGRIRELYGEPDRVQEIALPGSKLVLSFYGLTSPATVTFAFRTQDPNRIDRIVLSRRPE
jgi:hypothetical protein